MRCLNVEFIFFLLCVCACKLSVLVQSLEKDSYHYILRKISK